MRNVICFKKIVSLILSITLILGGMAFTPLEVCTGQVVQTKRLQDCNEGSFDNSTGSFVDALGNNGGSNVDLKGQPYTNAIEGRLVRSASEGQSSWAWKEYNVGGNYAKFTTHTVVFRESENTSDYEILLSFYGDGNKLKSYKLTPSVVNFDINLDITGVSVLKVIFEDKKAVKGTTSYGLADAYLHPAQDTSKLQRDAEEGWLEAQPIIASDRYTGNVGDSFIDTISGPRRIDRTVGYGNGNVDVNGNKYDHGLEAWIARWNFRPETSWAWISFDIGEKYNYLQGEIVQIGCYNSTNFDSTLYFYGDNKLLASYSLKPGKVNQDFEIDVTGVKELKVSVADNQAVKGGTSFGIVNAQFVSKSTVSYNGTINHYYGQDKSQLTPQGKINRDAKALQEAINTYLEILETNAKKEQNKKVDDYVALGAKLQAEDKALGIHRRLTIVGLSSEKEKAAYQAYAKFLTEFYREGVEIGKIDIDDNTTLISAKIIKKIIENLNHVEFTEKFNGIKVYLNVNCDMGAFTGYMIVGGEHVGITSDPQKVAELMTQYINELSALVNDVTKQGLWALVDFLEKESMIQDIVKEDIEKALKNKIAVFQSRGLGDVLRYILIYKEGYECAKGFINVDNSKQFAKALRNADYYLEKIDELAFDTDETITNKAVLDAMNSVTKAKNKLRNSLYDYVYNSNQYEGPSTWEQFLRFFGIHCPVDFTLFDKNNNVIGYVRDGEVYYNEDVAYIVVDGDAKSVYVSQDVDFRIELEATDDGTMDYFIQDLSEDGLYGRMNFYSVPLIEGNKFSQVVSADTLTRNLTDIPLIAGDGTSIYADEFIPAIDNTSLVMVTTTVSEGGEVVGDGDYVKGDLVKLSAYSKEGYEFDGWYEGDSLVYNKSSYYFTAVSNMNVKAKFTEITETEETPEEIDNTIKVSEILLDKSEINLHVGEEAELHATVVPSDATEKSVAWISNDTAIAVINNGKVIGSGVGTTNIIAYATDGSGIKSQCKISVKAKSYIGNGNNTETSDNSGSSSNSGTSSSGTSADSEISDGSEYQDDVDTTDNLETVHNNNGKVEIGETDSTGVYVAISSTEAAYAPMKPCGEQRVSIASSVVIDGVKVKVTQIGENAFKNNKKVKTIIIGKNIKSIGKNAFYGAKKLQSVTFKGTALVEIGSGAFQNANSIKKLDLSKQKVLKEIGKNAFCGCKSLKSINLNVTRLKTIGNNAFKTGSKLKVSLAAKNKNIYETIKKKLKKVGAQNADFKYVRADKSNLYEREISSDLYVTIEG